MAKYIKRKVPGLLDQEFREQELRARKKSILVLDDIVEWEAFREMAERAVVREWKGNQGRPMFPPLQMFKVLVIQNYYHLSDERMEEMLLRTRAGTGDLTNHESREEFQVFWERYFVGWADDSLNPDEEP